MKPFFLMLALLSTTASSSSEAAFTIQDYNAALPVWGTSWKKGDDAINGYYPSFYTGFAPRNNEPTRITVKLARGNQTRVSMILDDTTINDYVFDLAKRYEFYASVTGGSRPVVRTEISGASTLPQLSSFNKVIESEAYGILPFVRSAGNASPEAIFEKGLATVAALNPGRVFNIRLDLAKEFAKWKSQVNEITGGRDSASYFAKNPAQAVIAINGLVFGRVNYTAQPSAELLSALADAADASNDAGAFVPAAFRAFQLATGKKYAFRTLVNGQWQPALQCASASDCSLTYPEFTTIYPTGSVKSQTRDQFGNSIANFATPGLWNFLSRNYHEVDNIRNEPFYGWAPKMDYEEAGNGFHNPAVRFTEGDLRGEVKTTLAIPQNHQSFWSVMRGGVSHGCSRLPLGHVWEMRHLFPVENDRMTQLFYFGSNPQDFDVYDIDGDGNPEVMGVEYLISYGMKSADGLGSREGSDLEIGSGKKRAFYDNLYGARNVFTVDANGTYQFREPSVSLPSYLDYQKKKIQARLKVSGTLPLYEQAYEQDKVQFYVPFSTSGLTNKGAAPLSKKLVRLMGRVRGCAPSTDKVTCGEAAFDREAADILKQIR